ncbi:MAG: SurA N-terminal domain-containing protein, partial [Armatimonadota bacterium]|nr:SurA N-terminal domain-containing protein [Armatimonadota bacterium]
MAVTDKSTGSPSPNTNPSPKSRDVTTSKASSRTPLKNSPKSPPRAPGRDYQGTPLSMTGIRTNLLHSLFMKLVLGFIIVVFAVGFGISTISPRFNDLEPAPKPIGSGPEMVAVVGSQRIERAKFRQAYAQQLQFREQFGQKPGAAELLSLRQSALQPLIDQATQYEAAKKDGITVSGEEIDEEIDKQIEDTIKQQKQGNEANFRRQVEAKYGSMDELKEKMRADYDRDAIERKVAIDKLEKKIKDNNKVTEEDYKRSVTKLHLRQLVVRPKAPGPTEKDYKAAQEKNAAQAKERAEKIAAQLRQKPDFTNFVAVVKKESDDVATKTKGGDLGWKLPKDLPVSPTVKDALLKSSETIIGPVQDDFAKDFYIFFVQERKLELPKDYAKNKSEYIKNYETERDNEAWSKYQEETKKTVEPEINDPALTAYKIQMEKIFSAPQDQQNKLREEALAKYEEALNYAAPIEAAAIHYQMAQLH